MKDVLVKQFKIADHRIHLEGQARNTYENLMYSKPLIIGEEVGIITSEFRTVRVALIANYMKLNAQVLEVKIVGYKRYKLELRKHLAI